MSPRRHSPAASALGAVGGAMILLAGCANLENAVNDVLGDGGREPATVAYACDDDRDFVARYSADRDEVSVRTGDDTYGLELVDRVGDQRVYSEGDDDDDDDNVRLTVGDGGREARLRIPNEADFDDCEAEL